MYVSFSLDFVRYAGRPLATREPAEFNMGCYRCYGLGASARAQCPYLLMLNSTMTALTRSQWTVSFTVSFHWSMSANFCVDKVCLIVCLHLHS